MKRSFDRDQILPAFKCDLEELEALVQQLLKFFEGGDPHISIHIDFPGEDLEFNSFEELRSYTRLPNVVTKFRLGIYDWKTGVNRHCSLSLSWSDAAKANAVSDNVSWNAGIIGIIKDFAVRNRRWYGGLRRWMVFVMVMVIGYLPSVTKGVLANTSFAVAWVLTLALLCLILTLGWERVFPGATLAIRNEPSWLRRYQAEITALGALVSAVAALLAAWWAWRK